MAATAEKLNITSLRLPACHQMILPAQWSAAGASVGGAFLVAGVAIMAVSAWLMIKHIFLFDFTLWIAAPFMIWQGLEALVPYRHQVVIDAQNARVEKLLGFGRRHLTVPLANVTRVELDAEHWYSRLGRAMRAVGRPRFVLRTMQEGGKTTTILTGYPREVLEFLGNAILTRPRPRDAAAAEFLDQSAIPPDLRDLDNMPANGSIQHAAIDGMHTWILHRHGAVRTRKGFIVRLVVLLIPISICVLGFAMTLLNFLMIRGRHRHPMGMLTVSFLFAFLGLLVSRYLRRIIRDYLLKTVIVASPEGLTVIERSGNVTRELSFPTPTIAGVDVQYPRPTEARSFVLSREIDSRSLQIVVVHVQGTRQAVLTGPPLEIRWLTTQMRGVLGVGRGAGRDENNARAS